jgi:uncharacterized repeat protein (TIGR01451 family)
MLALAGCGAAGEEAPVEEEPEAEDTGIEEATLEESTLEESTEARSETTVTSATATNSGDVQSERANASPGEEEAVGKQELARTTQPGVSTTQKADPDPASVGQPLTFTVSVMNHSAPQRVGLKDFLPPSMTLVSVTPSQGTCGTGHHGSNEVGCTLGLVPSGGSATVEIVATPTVPGTMKNTAVSLAEFTPATPANSSVSNITVNPAS